MHRRPAGLLVANLCLCLACHLCRHLRPPSAFWEAWCQHSTTAMEMSCTFAKLSRLLRGTNPLCVRERRVPDWSGAEFE